MGDIAFFAGLVWWFAAAGYASHLASIKGHGGTAWFLSGLLFAPIVLVAAAGLPDLRARTNG